MNNAERVDGITAAFYNAIRAERKGGSLNQCASITFIVPRKYVRISPEMRKRNTRANARYYLPLLARIRRRTRSSPSSPHGIVAHCYKKERPGEGYYSPYSPFPPLTKLNAINPRAIISNSFHANPRQCFTTFPRASY